MKAAILSFSLILIFLSGAVLGQSLEPTEEEAAISVTLTDISSNPLEGEKFIFEEITKHKKYEAITDEKGEFSILLPEGFTYVIKIDMLSDDYEYDTLEIPGGPGSYFSTIGIMIEMPKLYTLNNVYFDSGKSTLKKSSYTELDELVDLMNRKESLEIEIAGHTDSEGDSLKNQTLSEDRAKAVQKYLIKKGISKSRVKAVGYGETQPVADNSTDEGRRLNRRTEVLILKE